MSWRKKLTFIKDFIKPGGTDSNICSEGSKCETLGHVIGLNNAMESPGSVSMEPGLYNIPHLTAYLMERWREMERGERWEIRYQIVFLIL
jgi:hypothetical protein